MCDVPFNNVDCEQDRAPPWNRSRSRRFLEDAGVTGNPELTLDGRQQAVARGEAKHVPKDRIRPALSAQRRQGSYHYFLR